MSAQPGLAFPSGRPNAQMRMPGQLGNLRTMIVGTAAIIASLGAFSMLQWKRQNPNYINDPARMPTWQSRYAQQFAGFNDRMSVLAEAKPTMPATAAAVASEAKIPGEHIRTSDRGIASSILTTLHGDPREENKKKSRRVEQPAPVTRLNDRGGIYTKNSDYKDSFRRY